MSVLLNPYRFAAAGGDAAILALGLTGWWDPSDLTNQFTDTGGSTPAVVGNSIARANDKSGSGNTLLQSGLNKPILRQDGSGFYYWEFSSTGTWMDCTGLTLTQPNDFVIGAYSTSNVARNAFDGITTRQALVFSTTIGVYAGTATRACGSVSTNTLYVFTSRFDGASSLVRTNGVSTSVSSSPGANGLSGLRMGTFSGSTGAWNGRIYGLLCRDTVFSAGELTTVEAYMAGKMGITI